LPKQNQLALAVTERGAWFDDEQGIPGRETAFLDPEFTVVTELDFVMNDFSVQAKNQQIQAVVQGFREIGRLASGFIKLQSAAYFMAGRVGTEDNQFIPRKSGQLGEGDSGLLAIANFLLERPADLAAGCVAVDIAASGEREEAQRKDGEHE
jgi:hypothetical protein